MSEDTLTLQGVLSSLEGLYGRSDDALQSDKYHYNQFKYLKIILNQLNQDEITAIQVDRVIQICSMYSTDLQCIPYILSIIYLLVSKEIPHVDYIQSALTTLEILRLKCVELEAKNIRTFALKILLSHSKTTLNLLVCNYCPVLIETFGVFLKLSPSIPKVLDIKMEAFVLLELLNILQPGELYIFVKEGIPLWLSGVVPTLIDFLDTTSDNDMARSSLRLVELLADEVIKVDYFEYPEWPNFMKSVLFPNMVPATITSLLKNGKDTWYIIWIMIIKLLKSFVTRNYETLGTPINSMLPVVETAFKMEPIQRIRAFTCWNELVENFSRETNPNCILKRVKLLVVPLKLNNAKTEDVIQAKFNTWWFLIRKFESRLDKVTNEVLVPFLQFILGRDPSKPMFWAGQLPFTRKKCVEAFVEIIGHDQLGCQCDIDIPRLDGKVISKILIIDQWDSWLCALKSAIRLVSVDWDEAQAISSATSPQHHMARPLSSYLRCIWISFVMLIAELPDNAVRRDMFDDLIDTLAVVLQDQNKPISLPAIIVEILAMPLFIDNRTKTLLNSKSEEHRPMHKVLGIILDKSFDGYYRRCSSQELQNIFHPIVWMIVNESVSTPAYLLWLLDQIPKTNGAMKLWTVLAQTASETNLCVQVFNAILKWPFKSVQNCDEVEEAAAAWYTLYNIVHIELEKIGFDNEVTEILMEPDEENKSSVYFISFALIGVLKHKPDQDKMAKLDSMTKQMLNWECKENEQLLPSLVDILILMIEKLSMNMDETLAQSTINCVRNAFVIMTSVTECFEDVSTENIPSINKTELFDTLMSAMKKFVSARSREAISNDIEDIISLVENPKKTDVVSKEFASPKLQDVPKKKKEPKIVNTFVENGEVYVEVKSNWKFNPKKLTENQKERLQKKRDNIPALYQDLSQSQDEFNLTSWKPDSQDTSISSSKSAASIGASEILNVMQSADVVPRIMENFFDKNKQQNAFDTASPARSESPLPTSLPALAAPPVSTVSPACASSPADAASPVSTVSPACASSPARAASPVNSTVLASHTLAASTTSPAHNTTSARTASPMSNVTPASNSSPARISSPALISSPVSAASPARASSPASKDTSGEVNKTPTPKSIKSPRMALKDRIFRNVRNLIEKSSPQFLDKEHQVPITIINNIAITPVSNATTKFVTSYKQEESRKEENLNFTPIRNVRNLIEKSSPQILDKEHQVPITIIDNIAITPVSNATTKFVTSYKQEESRKEENLNFTPNGSEIRGKNKKIVTKPNDLIIRLSCTPAKKTIEKDDLNITKSAPLPPIDRPSRMKRKPKKFDNSLLLDIKKRRNLNTEALTNLSQDNNLEVTKTQIHISNENEESQINNDAKEFKKIKGNTSKKSQVREPEITVSQKHTFNTDDTVSENENLESDPDAKATKQSKNSEIIVGNEILEENIIQCDIFQSQDNRETSKTADVALILSPTTPTLKKKNDLTPEKPCTVREGEVPGDKNEASEGNKNNTLQSGPNVIVEVLPVETTPLYLMRETVCQKSGAKNDDLQFKNTKKQDTITTPLIKTRKAKALFENSTKQNKSTTVITSLIETNNLREQKSLQTEKKIVVQVNKTHQKSKENNNDAKSNIEEIVTTTPNSRVKDTAQTSTAKKSGKKSLIEKQLRIDTVEGHPLLKVQSERRLTRKQILEAENNNSNTRKTVKKRLGQSKSDATPKTYKKAKENTSPTSHCITVEDSQDRNCLSKDASVDNPPCSEDIIESSQDSTMTTISVKSKTLPKRLVVALEIINVNDAKNTQDLIQDSEINDVSDKKKHDASDIELSQNRTAEEDKNTTDLTENMDTEPINGSGDVEIPCDIIPIPEPVPVPAVTVGPDTQELAEADTLPNDPLAFLELTRVIERQPLVIEHAANKTKEQLPDNDITQSLPETPLAKSNEASSPFKDDEQRKQDFLNNTIQISPIKMQSPEKEKKALSPETSCDFLLVKLSSPVHCNGEPYEKRGSPEFFSEDRASPDGRNASPPRPEAAATSTSPSSSLSLKKNRTQVRPSGRAAHMLGLLCVSDDKVKKLSTSTEPETVKKTSTPAKRNLRILYNSVGDQSETGEQSSLPMSNGSESFLKLNRALPTVTSSPSGPILKRKLAEITDETTISPASKTKRVSFHDPPVSTTISVHKYIDMLCYSPQSSKKRMDRPTRQGAKSPKRLENAFNLDTVLSHAVESFAETSTPTDDTQNISLDITPAVEVVITSDLNDTDPICPELVDCEDPIDAISLELSSPAMRELLVKELAGKIETVADLAKLTELEVNRLCIKAPKIQVAKKVLGEYALKRPCAVETVVEEAFSEPLTETLLGDKTASVEVQCDADELRAEMQVDVEPANAPMALASTQTDDVVTVHASMQTDESGSKATADIISTCLSERDDFVQTLTEKLDLESKKIISKSLPSKEILDALLQQVDTLPIVPKKEKASAELSFLRKHLHERYEDTELILLCSQLLHDIGTL